MTKLAKRKDFQPRYGGDLSMGLRNGYCLARA